MAENEAKGWYGSYSLEGKIYAEKFNNIIHKDEILKGEFRKIKIHDLFTPDNPKINHIDDHLNILKIYSFEDNAFHKAQKKQKKKTESLTKMKNEKHSFKLFFHNNHCASNEKWLKKIGPNPECTKYNPNYKYIWPKLLTGPKWEKLSGRYQKTEIDNRDFCSNKYILNSGESKCFVNMNKTTQRGSFIDFKDIKLKGEKHFTKDSNTKIKKGLAYDLTEGGRPRTFMNCFYRLKSSYKNNKNPKVLINLKNHSKMNKKNNLTEENLVSKISQAIQVKKDKNNKNENIKTEEGDDITYSEFSDIKSFSIKKNNFKSKNNLKDSNLATMGTEEINYYKIKNTAPDFSKIISREKRQKLNQNKTKTDNIPFFMPNLSFVKENPKVFTLYKKNKSYVKDKRRDIMGLYSSFNYNPDLIIEKYNNHPTTNGPLFKNMVSRPNKKGSPLPSYMQHIHDRSSIYVVTDKSLQLNKYADGKYIPATSSFFPKKSFNNIINLGLINSKVFKENNPDEDIQAKKKRITKKLSLNNVNCKELIDEGALSKFDNFCYKTILKKKKKVNINKLIMNFEEEHDDKDI